MQDLAKPWLKLSYFRAIQERFWKGVTLRDLAVYCVTCAIVAMYNMNKSIPSNFQIVDIC